jgi:ribosomal protein S18 acetylase RimI-like enzyme
MPVVIRSCRPDDARSLGAILTPAFAAGDTYAVPTDMTVEGALAYWCGSGKSVFVAEEGGGIVGTYFLTANQGGGGAHVCNCGFVTDRAARGRGMASAMLAHALDTARQQGYRAMQFNFVVETNTGAIRLWRRAGFSTVGRLPRAFRHPQAGYVDALVMYKTL